MEQQHIRDHEFRSLVRGNNDEFGIANRLIVIVAALVIVSVLASILAILGSAA